MIAGHCGLTASQTTPCPLQAVQNIHWISHKARFLAQSSSEGPVDKDDMLNLADQVDKAKTLCFNNEAIALFRLGALPLASSSTCSHAPTSISPPPSVFFSRGFGARGRPFAILNACLTAEQHDEVIRVTTRALAIDSKNEKVQFPQPPFHALLLSSTQARAREARGAHPAQVCARIRMPSRRVPVLRRMPLCEVRRGIGLQLFPSFTVAFRV